MKPTTMSEKIAVDTNIIIYSLNDSYPEKKKVALNIICNLPYLSSQAFTESINICRRKLKYDKIKQMKVANFILDNCQFESVDPPTIRLSHELIVRYDFQYFDAIIVSSALQANCTILYTEDMQHQLLVEKRLRIINPFV